MWDTLLGIFFHLGEIHVKERGLVTSVIRIVCLIYSIQVNVALVAICTF